MAKRALISVFDKTGIVDFAKALINNGWEIISTGGTRKTFENAGIPARDITELTGFPEIFDGRVKTLIPQVHAGLLARRNRSDDMAMLSQLNIATIDMVVVNLYPFFDKVNDDSISEEEKIEFIDIGGPTMLRSAAKNFSDVLVICEPEDYQTVLEEILSGEICIQTRKKLAGKVFNLTSAYDAAISRFLLNDPFPKYYNFSYQKAYDLRYGENPHQKAAYYIDTTEPGSIRDFEQLNGKELSYNNLKDLEIAWRMVSEFDKPFCCALKHNTPCGAATGETILEAFQKTFRCDPVSIFGGIIGANCTIDKEAAREMSSIFLEIIAAPDFTDDALELLNKKKNLRILKMKGKSQPSVSFAKVNGGLLVQSEDDILLEDIKAVTKANYADQYQQDILFGLKIVKYVKSNAIAIVKNGATLGLGGGQVNRIWPTKDALTRAAEVCKQNPQIGDLSDAVLVSDAFFPFEDCVQAANDYGVQMIVQPGGSTNDQRSIDACNECGICMVMTGIRHFMH